MATYTYPRYDYVKPAELSGGAATRPPVVVVGAGLVGLTMALDLAHRGVACVVLDDDETVSHGSRSICQAKRTLEIWDRLGVAGEMMDKGVTWNDGRVFYRDSELYQFNLQDTPDSKFPAFINLQQYYVEQYLVEAAQDSDLIELRWRNQVTGIDTTAADGVTADVETPDGKYSLACDWLIAADGAHSTIRREMGLDFIGEVFQDHFLIADIEMEVDFPVERRFWFDPPWGPEQSALLHMQSDNKWRLDFQLGWDIDKEKEMKPENVIPRVKRMIGDDVEFEFEWISIYTFQCRRLEKFKHGRVFFVGDAAHQVSPFGARGGNTGVQDADNLGWKLGLVLDGRAPEALLESYDQERVPASAESIMHSTRATDFITPKGPVSRAFRDAVLELARNYPFARALVNSGRLSTPTLLRDSPLNSYNVGFNGTGVPLGWPCPSVPVEAQYNGGDAVSHLPDALGGGFCGLYFAETEGDIPGDILSGLLDLAGAELPVTTFLVSPLQNAASKLRGLFDRLGAVAQAMAAEPGTFYLVRPDQHVCARWRSLDIGQLETALHTAVAQRRSGSEQAVSGGQA
ncbi:MAG: FAD-dependent oxidoreductase [Minwuiales bacterium]|nr:FAD-dependent oxidoreductase [Minwuiales bacterium]